MNDTSAATPEAVLRAHLERARTGREEEFLRSYREDSFLITAWGVKHGLEDIRACYRQLQADLPNARFSYDVCLVEQGVGFLKWSADSDTNTVSDGADSYVIHDGYIAAQTIHYTPLPKRRVK